MIPAPRLRVFLADDHPLVLDGLKALLACDDRLELAGSANDGLAALNGAIEARADVAVLDMSMPGLAGPEVARRLLAACPRCRVLMLTVNEDGAMVRELLALGVAGYVLKRSATAELARGIHAVAAGGIFLDPAVASAALGRDGAIEKPLAAGPAVELSGREEEVLSLTAAGHSNKTIAARLRIGVKSVDTYKARAMSKLGFHNRVDVVRYAMGKGWLNDAERGLFPEPRAARRDGAA